MRILFVIESLGFGGAERAIVSLLPALLRAGVECEVASLWGSDALAPEIERLGVKVHRLGVRHRWHAVDAVRKLTQLQHRRYDVIDAHLFFAEIYAAIAAIGDRHALRVVTFHSHAFDVDVWGDSPWKRARRGLESLLLRRFIDGYAACSEASAEHMGSHLGLANVEVIHNAYDLEKLTPIEGLSRAEVLGAIEPGLDEEFVLITPARLSHEKGHTFLFDALEQLRRKDLRPRALLAGTGVFEPTLREEVARRDLGAQVKFLGSVPHHELLKIVQCADALVLPSTHEGLPLAAVEAMSLERPVVASRVGGVPEVIEDGVSGLMMDVGDSTGLAKHIEAIMTDAELRSRLSRAARARISAEFSADAIARHRLDWYAKLRPALGSA